jgi:hypothetical protein
MSPLQRRIVTVTATTALLVAQLRDLDRLREQLRKALLAAEKAPRPKGRTRPAIKRVLPELVVRAPTRSRSGPSNSIAPVP